MIVFDEAHNIDNICIDSMSVKVNRKLLEKCQNSITVLEDEIKHLKEADSHRLRDEYEKLVEGLKQAQERRDNALVLANPGMNLRKDSLVFSNSYFCIFRFIIDLFFHLSEVNIFLENRNYSGATTKIFQKNSEAFYKHERIYS